MSDRLAVIVPTRGRPENVRKVIGAWDFTNAWDVADLILAVDGDDPELVEYQEPSISDHAYVVVHDIWLPMVHKLNRTAGSPAYADRYFALGFAGDDHLPRTMNWAQRYLTVLRELGTGMVYGDDGYQGAKLSTEWAVTADAVRALGRMVPAPVEHMYCDNSMMDVFGGAGAMRHLPEIRIEHMHPVAGKATSDDQYQRVNHRDQYAKDRRAYDRWRSSGMVTDINAIRDLRGDLPQVPPPAVKPITPPRRGREVRRSGPRQRGSQSMAKFPFSRQFKYVTGATPDEIAMTLADLAVVVPADQEIVELGVFQGRTALIMAWGAAQGNGAHVTAIDAWDLPGNTYDPPFTDEETERRARYNVAVHGFADQVTLIKGFAVEVAGDWEHAPNQVGLLFVDDDHSRDGVVNAIQSWAPHLAPGATIAVDDYGHPDWPGVAEGVDELVASGFLAPLEIHHDRLAVTRLDTETRKTTSITAEGVSPSPYPAAEGQVAVPEVRQMVDGPHWENEPARSEADTSNLIVKDGEVDGVAAGTMADTLGIYQLRQLAKARKITLGARKDSRARMIDAIRDGA